VRKTDFVHTRLFNLERTIAAGLFDRTAFGWEVLPLLKEFILEQGPKLGKDFEQVSENVWVGKGTKIDPLAALRGPAIVGHDCELRPGCYLREYVIAGNNCVLGNSTEIKNSILFDGVQAAHFNYIGDSVLGYMVHLGAGVVLSNLKYTKTEIILHPEEGSTSTGLKKFGALVGDFVDIGSQAVLNPGTIVGRNSVIYPLVNLRGLVPQDKIVKGPHEWDHLR
jgi:NDP-sugar pyrophosphorylase family protein